MRMRQAVIAVVVMMAFAAVAPASAEDPPFDYFLLVRQWSAGVCESSKEPCTVDVKPDFTIHGLWPNNNDGSYPQFCDSKHKFSISEVRDLLSELQVFWPSLFGSEQVFLKHEWEKHGTCAEDMFDNSIHEWFSAILDLHKQYDIKAALQQESITPSDTDEYKVGAIEKAIEDAYGVAPMVHCDGGKYLTEVWMCFDLNLQPFDCRREVRQTCHLGEATYSIPSSLARAS